MVMSTKWCKIVATIDTYRSFKAFLHVIYIHQVNGVKLAEIMFSLLRVCLCTHSPVREKPGSNRGPFACEANVITTTYGNVLHNGGYKFLNARPASSKQKQNNDLGRWCIRQTILNSAGL